MDEAMAATSEQQRDQQYAPHTATVNDLSVLDTAEHIWCEVILIQGPEEQAEKQTDLEQGSN